MKRLALTAALAAAALALTACDTPSGDVVNHSYSPSTVGVATTCDYQGKCHVGTVYVPATYSLQVRDDKTEERTWVQVGSDAYDNCTKTGYAHFPECAA